MINIPAEIITTLKEELEYIDDGYSQWILAVSIRKEHTKDGAIEYTARVVLKTNESPYVDGMDIRLKVTKEEVQLESGWYENTPDFQGGTVEDSITWLKELGEIKYLNVKNTRR